jgi:hypothetical protein
VQRVEDFGWCLEAEAFSGRVVIVCDDGIELGLRQGGEVSFSGKCASEASDGVFDAALLPRCSGIAEVSADAEVACEVLVPVELGAVIEGN